MGLHPFLLLRSHSPRAAPDISPTIHEPEATEPWVALQLPTRATASPALSALADGSHPVTQAATISEVIYPPRDSGSHAWNGRPGVIELETCGLPSGMLSEMGGATLSFGGVEPCPGCCRSAAAKTACSGGAR